MGALLEELKAYITSASKEQIRRDWEELKEYNEYGQEMLAVLDTP